MTINCEWLLNLLEDYEYNQLFRPSDKLYDMIRFLRDQPKDSVIELKLKIE